MSPAPPPKDFEVSAVFLGGMTKVLKANGTYGAVLERLSPEAREAFAEPYARRWWPSAVLEDVLARGVDLTPDGYTELNYAMTKNSLGPIVGPIFAVAMTLSGATPATVFARLDKAIRAGMNGVTAEWAPLSSTRGVLRITYPRPWLSVAEHTWRGTIRFAFDFCGVKTGRVEDFRLLHGRTVFEFDVAW